MTLFRCDRLHASISDKQCNVNFNSGHISCQGCPGLGDAVLLPDAQFIKETEMPRPRGFCNSCLKDDRPLLSKNSDGCDSCYKRRRDAEKAAKLATVNQELGAVVDEFVAAQEMERADVKEVAAVREADAWEMDDLRGHYEVEPPRPQVSALCRLLDPDGWLVEIPRDISLRLGEEGITPDDINELLQALVNGELRRVA